MPPFLTDAPISLNARHPSPSLTPRPTATPRLAPAAQHVCTHSRGSAEGLRGTTKYDVEVLAEITDRFIDYCLDNPKDNALAAFEKIAR